MSRPVAILAGGLATRLGDAASRLPKSLVDVAGKPFVLHQLALLAAAGFHDVVFCIGHLGSMLRDALGNGEHLGMCVRYSDEGDVRLGTGGALRRALPMLGDSFLVLYGDSYLRCDYAAVENAFHTSGCDALMTVYRNDGAYDASNVVYADGRIVRYDKTERTPDMRHIDYGLGVFRSSVFTPYPEDAAFDLADVYHACLRRESLAAYEVVERFYEIGSPAGLAELRTLLSRP